MSKKMLKRSLALGALMAFVITGSAMAADADGSVLLVTGSQKYTGTEIVADALGYGDTALSEDDNRSYGLGVNSGPHTIDNNLTITNELSGSNRNYGIAVNGNAQLTINGEVKISASGGSGQGVRGIRNNGNGAILTFSDAVNVGVQLNGGDYVTGMDTWNGTTYFNSNTSIIASGSSCSDFVNAVQIGNDAKIYFSGDETILSAEHNGYTAQTISVARANAEIHFDSSVVNIYSLSNHGANGIAGATNCDTTNSKVSFTGEDAVVNVNVVVDSDKDGNGDTGETNAVGIMGIGIEVGNKVKEFNVTVKGSGLTTVDGTAGLYACDNKNMDIAAKNLNINVTGSDDVAENRSDSYGIYAPVSGTVRVDSDVVNIKVTDTIGEAYSLYAKGTASISVAAGKANIKGSMYVGENATLDISGIQDLVLEGLEAGNGDAAIQVNGGTLKVNTAGTLEIKDAGAGIYKVASGVDSILWKDENLVYDRTTLLAKGILEEQDYKVEYDAFDASTATDEQLKEAQQQIVTATGGEELAVPSLVGSVAGAGTVMEETAKGAKEFLGSITSNAEMPKETKAAVINSAAQLAEAGGNAGTAVSVANNVAGVTTGRMSFGGRGHGGHKGGHGVGMFEEGSGAAVWAQYMHGKDDATDMPMDGGATSYESEYDGIVLGVDFKKVGKFQSGVAFNYGEGDSTGFSSGTKTKSDYDFWGIGYYGNIRNADTNFIFDINYAKSDSDVTQNTNAGSTRGVIEASPETTTWSAGVKVEKLYQNNNVQIVPYTGLRFMSIDTDEYKSNFNGETLFNYAPERQDIWLLPLGVTIKQEVVNDNGWVVTPKVDLSYIWAFGDTDSNMSVSIPGIAASNDTLGFTVMDDGSFLGLVGVEAKLDDWSFGVSYSYQKGDYAESKKWFVDAKYSF